MSTISRAQILDMIPHAGAMCLLDEILSWDTTSLCCLSRRYRQTDNPMRRADGVLGAAGGIEIAAQAMAVHGYLCAGSGGPPRPGRLVSLRDVQLTGFSFAAISGALLVEAECLTGDAGGASYGFRLSAQGVNLVSGRATVLLGLDA